MNYPRINEELHKQLQNYFPKRKFGEHYYEHRSWQTSRYIQILTPINDEYIHYEYCVEEDEGRIELHFESDGKEEKYNTLIDELSDRTQSNDDMSWSGLGDYGYRCTYKKKIETLDDLKTHLTVFMEYFDNLLKEATKKSISIKHSKLQVNDSLQNTNGKVNIKIMTLKEVLSLPLSIPDYQRIYCWEESNVKCLLDDVFDHVDNIDKKDVPYRLGSIILHAINGSYDIIDGQQRLITLALLLNELGVDSKLLNQKIISKRSREYVAYNKHLISTYVKRKTRNQGVLSTKILEKVDFSVLILRNASLDLAYTFFSNQNSRGVVLSDYDLLKAHHLRYIPQTFEEQSTRAAQVWNKMIEAGRSKSTESEKPDYVKTLDTYLYRLRKWMRKKDCLDESVSYRIKQEYEAAPIIEEIPPFGERFYFNEPIQGGVHFFSFVEQHLDKYHQFVLTPEYVALHQNMSVGSHRWYRDAIESILFGYFLKFGTFYLSDALVVIMRIILQHRYITERTQRNSIIKYTSDSELILIIDQATSPTFFLAEARNIAKELDYPLRQKMYPIQIRMRYIATAVSRQLEANIVTNVFKNLNR